MYIASSCIFGGEIVHVAMHLHATRSYIYCDCSSPPFLSSSSSSFSVAIKKLSSLQRILVVH